MPSKIDINRLKRPTVSTETKTFTDPNAPDVELTLTLKTLDSAELTLASEEAADILLHYWGNKEAKIKPQEPFPPVDGQPVRGSLRLCRNCKIIERMQAGPREERYDFYQLVTISITMPTAWQEIITWSNQIGEQEEKNASLVDTASSSYPPSKEDKPTQTSSLQPSADSTPSMSG